MVPHSWIFFFFRKTLIVRIFCAFILCQRERKRHWVVRRARPCVLRFHVVDHFILGGRRPWVSKHHSDCVRGEICFKEIMSNTRLDLNHSSFMHLVCEFLIICRFLLKSIQYLCHAPNPRIKIDMWQLPHAYKVSTLQVYKAFLATKIYPKKLNQINPKYLNSFFMK